MQLLTRVTRNRNNEKIIRNTLHPPKARVTFVTHKEGVNWAAAQTSWHKRFYLTKWKIKTSELQNAKYIFIQLAKGGFGFINSRSIAENWYNLENWKEMSLKDVA